MPVDFDGLGEVRVKTLLALPSNGWTPHQVEKAMEWLEGIRVSREAEAAKAASESLRVANQSLTVANQSLTVGKRSLRVMWLTLAIALATLLATYLLAPNS
ncbi:hypothetical protein [Dyella sp. 2HG41-7]|uniref:hypothetical protein n=1 Tax=Dyella sp. 2HG41-7 TaxID=2883239 RepID=UPI001F4702A8|nr:hypothetical protein [Dyella sp. 2HG41-7]